MRLTSDWFLCRCFAPVCESLVPGTENDDMPEVRIADVVVTPPRDGPQVDTEHQHECGQGWHAQTY